MRTTLLTSCPVACLRTTSRMRSVICNSCIRAFGYAATAPNPDCGSLRGNELLGPDNLHTDGVQDAGRPAYAAAHALLLVDGGKGAIEHHRDGIEEASLDALLASVTLFVIDHGAEAAGRCEFPDTGSHRCPVDAAVTAAVTDDVADALLVLGDVHQALFLAHLQHAQGFFAAQLAAGTALDRVIGCSIELEAHLDRLSAGAVDSPAGAFGNRDVLRLVDEIADIVRGEDL